MPNPILLEDHFTIRQINPNGAEYLRVSRAVCHNKSGTLSVIMDYNLEEFPLVKDEQLSIAVASSLERSGQPSKQVYDHSIYHRETLLDLYDYVMHGRIYESNVEDASVTEVSVHISFGGLLCKITGRPDVLKELHYNANVFLLVKRVGK